MTNLTDAELAEYAERPKGSISTNLAFGLRAALELQDARKALRKLADGLVFRGVAPLAGFENGPVEAALAELDRHRGEQP